MSNVVRLVNGGSIQVRTGVIQGIGPQGPRGVAGPQGPQGEQGPVGEQGPMGQILQAQSLTRVGSSNPVAANTDTTIAFGSIGYDPLSCFPSSSNIVLTNAGDYLLSCWLAFDAATATRREFWFAVAGATIARKSVIADTGIFYLDLAFPFHAAGGETVNVLARSGVATAVALGAMAVTRIGSGPAGVQGVAGPQGPIGPAGPKGDTGAPGTANSGFAKYSDLLPH